MSGAFVFAGVESDSPTLMLNEDEKPVACRGCLAAERPLKPLELALATLYEQLTGTSVSRSDIYPKFLCSHCRVMLLKFSEFRAKCLSVQETYLNLLNAGIPITTELIKSGVAGAPYPNLQATFVQSDGYQSAHKDSIDNICVEMTEEPIKEEGRVLEKESEDISNQINECTSNHTCHTANKNMVFVADADKEEKCIITDEEGFSDHDNDPDVEFENGGSDSNDESDSCISDLKKILAKTRSMRLKGRTKSLKRDSICTSKVKDSTKQIIRKKNINTRATKCLKNVVKNIINSNVHEDYPKLSKVAIVERKGGSSRKAKLSTDNSARKHSKLDDYFEFRRANSEKKLNVKYVRLSKEEQLKQVEERKFSINYKLAIYKCEICYRGFRMELAYKNHMMLHDPNRGDNVCEVCQMRFPTKRELAHHSYHTHRYDLVCNECGHVTKTSCNAAIHYRKHRGVKYPCKICGKTFDKPNRVFDHMNIAHEGALACNICDEKFIGQNGLRVHMNRAHKEAAGAVCSSCSVQFHSQSALRRHRPQGGSCDTTHRPCAVCGEGFLTDELLQQHKKEHHKNDYECAVCGKVLHSKMKYRNHVNHHIIQNKNKLSEQDLAADAKGVRVRKPQVFMCEMCGFSVKNSKQSLEKHLRTHTGEKLFQCEICQKRFTTKRYLGVHTAKHMGIVLPKKTFLCRYCDRPFNHQGNRDKHEKGVHQKLRPFDCGICDKTFQSKDAMQNHVNHTHQGVPWPKRTRKREGARTT